MNDRGNKCVKHTACRGDMGCFWIGGVMVSFLCRLGGHVVLILVACLFVFDGLICSFTGF